MSTLQEPIEAEFIEVESTDTALSSRAFEVSQIRRAPQAAQSISRGKISMALEDWLDVDRKLHELYALCDIAIMQRDQARSDGDSAKSARAASEDFSEKLAARLVEWKTYARKLERRAHEAQIELLTAEHEAARMRELAEEALELGLLDRKRRHELKKRISGES